MPMWGRLSVRTGLCRGERSSKMDSSIDGVPIGMKYVGIVGPASLLLSS